MRRRQAAEQAGFCALYVVNCTGFYVASGVRHLWLLTAADSSIWVCLSLAAR